jgi:SAM-dependent methyltransferase
MLSTYENQKHFWEKQSNRRDAHHPVIRAFSEPVVSTIVQFTGAHSHGQTLLEVGCGNGYFSVLLSKYFELKCLDFSKVMLAQNPIHESCKVIGDAEHLPFEPDSFDTVFCANLLHHLEDPAVAVKEMDRVAKKRVILFEPNILNPAMYLFGLAKPAERGSLKFTPRYLKGLGLKQGLKLRHFSTRGWVLPNKTPPLLLPLLRKIDSEMPFSFYNLAIFDATLS